MRQLLGAAAKLHAAGLIHRNMTPDNILVGPDGALKVCGFGCAIPARCVRKLCPEKPAWTLQYCAVEQLMGWWPYGPKVDVWALGCVMAELLTGEPLFTATTEEEMIEQAEEVHDEFNMGVECAFEDTMDLSLAGREVLAGLLAFDSNDRLTAADALKHRWFTEVDVVQVKPPAAAVEEESLCLPES
jgi:cell division cycle 2-like protein